MIFTDDALKLLKEEINRLISVKYPYFTVDILEMDALLGRLEAAEALAECDREHSEAQCELYEVWHKAAGK